MKTITRKCCLCGYEYPDFDLFPGDSIHQIQTWHCSAGINGHLHDEETAKLKAESFRDYPSNDEEVYIHKLIYGN